MFVGVCQTSSRSSDGLGNVNLNLECVERPTLKDGAAVVKAVDVLFGLWVSLSLLNQGLQEASPGPATPWLLHPSPWWPELALVIVSAF